MIKQIKRQNPRERLPDEKWTNEFEKAAIASIENTERNKFGRERSDEMKPEWIEKRKTSDFFFSMRSKSWEMKRIQYIGTSPFTMVSRTSYCRLIAIQRLRYKIWYRMTRTSPFGSSWRNGQPMIDFGPLFEVKWAQTSLFIMGLRIYGLWQGQTENPRIQSRNLAHRYP